MTLKNLWLAALEGLRYYFCLVPSEWWRRWPFLPLPSRRYITWRLDTAYGQVDNGWPRPPVLQLARDTVKFLIWRRKWRLRR